MLEYVTRRLWADLLDGLEEDEIALVKECQADPYQQGRKIVIPKYSDGEYSWGPTYLWVGRNGKFYAINHYGEKDIYRELPDAVTFAIVV